MDVVEYNAKRIVVADKRTMDTMLGFTFFFSGLFLFLVCYLLDAARYLVPAFIVTGIGAAIIYFSKEKTFCIFEGEKGKLEIIRKSLIGKTEVEQYDLKDIKKVHTVSESTPSEKLSYRVEMELADGVRVPLTRPFQKDQYGFETMANKIRSFLQI